jgi:hypothetical protein
MRVELLHRFKVLEKETIGMLLQLRKFVQASRAANSTAPSVVKKEVSGPRATGR